MRSMTGDSELWTRLADALDEAKLPIHLRDQIDNVVCDLVRDERRDVLSCLVIGVESPANAGDLDGWERRPLD